jgi:hypothetical protein
MILKPPHFRQGKAKGFAWYHTITSFTCLSAKLQTAAGKAYAPCADIAYCSNNPFLNFTYYLHCAISGPG